MENLKQVLSIRIDPSLYQRLKKRIGYGKVGRFAERAIAKELDNYEKRSEKSQEEFRQKLICGYQAMAKNEKLKKELSIWEEVLEDDWNK